MKTLFLFTLTIILSTNLSARENPFAVTDAYEEASARILEIDETPKTLESAQEAQYIKEMQEKMSKVTSLDANKNKVEEKINKIAPLIKENPAPKSYSKKEVDSMIQKTKSQTEQKTKEIVKKELSKTQALEPTQVVYVKPRADVINDDELVVKNYYLF